MSIKVAVIGAGPAGLVTAKYLLKAHKYFDVNPIDVTIFEANENIGGTFRYRVYEEAELVSSKYLTAFSDFRFGDDVPDFVTPATYLDYLAKYCDKFQLWNVIKFNTAVTSITHDKQKGKGHIVTYFDGVVIDFDHFDAVAVCSGLNVDGVLPDFPRESTNHKFMHSSEFKGRVDLFGSLIRPTGDGGKPNVAILGAGETAMDISHLAITTPEIGTVVMCHKDGFYCAPKTVPEPVICGLWGRGERRRPPKPIDTCVASLFDTAYVHPKLQRSNSLYKYYTWSINTLLWLVTGTWGGFDQWVGTMSKERLHSDAIFLCKSTRAIPYISAPYRKPSILNRIHLALSSVAVKDTEGRQIELAPWPTHIDRDGVMHFEDKDSPECKRMKEITFKPDIIICATGYTQKLRFLRQNYPLPSEANVRGIYYSSMLSFAYIGFVRPSIGAIPPLAEMQAQFWVLRLVKTIFQPDGLVIDEDPNALQPYEIDYKLHPRAGKDMFEQRRGVDHEAYAYQLALDIGAAPSFTFVRKQGLKVLWTWAMGSNFNTKFRLVGPWKNTDEAAHIMRTELFGVTKRLAGIPFFVIYTLIPFIVFGLLSGFLYLADQVNHLCGAERRERRRLRLL